MRIFAKLFLGLALSTYLILFNIGVANAAPVCAGTYTCYTVANLCTLPDGSGCSNPDPFTGCTCSYECDGSITGTFSCGPLGSACGSLVTTACDTGCPGHTGATLSNGCFLQPDACTVDSQCGSCGACCGGSPNYCRTDGFTCGGSPIAGCGAPPPTSPPTTCTPNQFISGTYCNPPGSLNCYDIYCNSAGTAQENRDYSGATCSFCAPTSAPTAPPTSAPTGGGGGSCSQTCSGSGACGGMAVCIGGCCTVPTPTPSGGSCGTCGGAECCDPGFCADLGASGPDPSDVCMIIVAPPPPVCGDSVCNGVETCSSCAGDCGVCSYDISGKVYVDSNGNGIQNCSGSCNNGSGDELNYIGATVSRSGGSPDTTDSSGSYSFNNIASGTYNITLALPSGYSLVSVAGNSNPRSVRIGPDASNINFAIRQSPPVCVPGLVSLNPSGGTANPGASKTLSVSACTNVENPDDGTPPPPFNWNPDTGGNNPPPITSGQTDTPTSSTITWTAPSCPSSQTTYTPQVTVGGVGGTTNYSTSITVPRTVSITTHVRSVGSIGACASSSGTAYNSGGVGANINVNGGGGTVNQNQTTNPGTGQAAFTCLPQGNYTVTLQVPAGYSVIGTDVTPAVESPVGSNGLSFATSTSDQTAVFCIAPIDPWFQTDLGDVRFVNLSNPVPTGQYGSSDATYPGIFYSSDSSANFGNAGNASSSVRQWVINNEYSYNADTENRNGGMSYDFYKSKALKDGVVVTQLTTGVLDEQQITDTGVYEANGNLTINSYNHTPGRRVVILVNGNVTINSEIDIPVGTGLFIVAAKGNITIDDTVGTTTITSSTSNLDGYYTAQGSIILESVGNGCADGVTSDRRLNVAGALVANSLKPFSSTGTGTVQNNRSLCLDNLTRPSLFIASRPDFLVQLTDFYKTSYTKWREVNP